MQRLTNRSWAVQRQQTNLLYNCLWPREYHRRGMGDCKVQNTSKAAGKQSMQEMAIQTNWNNVDISRHVNMEGGNFRKSHSYTKNYRKLVTPGKRRIRLSHV